jgi:hypothetical protein
MSVIAGFLAEEYDGNVDGVTPLASLSRLNRTCHTVREVTLPIPKRRTYLESDKIYTGLVGRDNPAGIKHIK